jgi:cation:H+ antiporter
VNAWLLIAVGLAVMILGAELLVRGGSRIAVRLSVPPIMMGLTVVSLGASAPELAIGIESARTGDAALAVGNIVGTNVVNLLLILGGSAAIRAIAIGMQSLRVDLPAIAGASVLLLVMVRDGRLTASEGGVLVVYGVAYTLLIVWMSKRGSASAIAEFDSELAHHREDRSRFHLVRDIVWLIGGIAVVVILADLLVDGAVDLERNLGVSEVLIGLTVVAIGTSAPELVTTLVSTLRGNRDIAIGNLLGSSVYNVALILGATMLVAPAAIEVPPEVVRIDVPIMTASALLCIPLFVSGRTVSRLEGAFLVACYAGYLGYLILGHR